MYCTTRVPGETIDQLKTHPLSKHIVVYHNGCMYRIEVFDGQGRLYSIEQLIEWGLFEYSLEMWNIHTFRIFTELILRKEDNASEHERRLPSLTHDHRDAWAKNRERFFTNNPVNSKLLEVIETAMF